MDTAADPILMLSDGGEFKEEISWVDQEGNLAFISLDLVKGLENKRVSFRSCCNGLLTYQFDRGRQAFLINPLRQEVMFLREPPPPEITRRPPKSSYGLGIGGISGVSKMVFLESTEAKYKGKWSTCLTAQVMTLGSSEWRRVENVPNEVFMSNPVFEKGFIYWLAGKWGSRKLLAFDVENEVFSTMKSPIKVSHIHDVGGLVALVFTSRNGLVALVSANHEANGRVCEWKKHDPITVVDGEGKPVAPYSVMLTGTWKDNTILLRSFALLKGIAGNLFFSYDFGSKKLTKVDCPSVKRGRFEYYSLRGSSHAMSGFRGCSVPVCLLPGESNNTR